VDDNHLEHAGLVSAVAQKTLTIRAIENPSEWPSDQRHLEGHLFVSNGRSRSSIGHPCLDALLIVKYLLLLIFVRLLHLLSFLLLLLLMLMLLMLLLLIHGETPYARQYTPLALGLDAPPALMDQFHITCVFTCSNRRRYLDPAIPLERMDGGQNSLLLPRPLDAAPSPEAHARLARVVSRLQ
jgi:hypothetical protein